LTCSLADADEVRRLGQSMSGPLVLTATDIGCSWTVYQADPNAALLWTPIADGRATVSGAVSDPLLWIYGRVELPTDQLERVAEVPQADLDRLAATRRSATGVPAQRPVRRLALAWLPK
jgi:hypothetical protein